MFNILLTIFFVVCKRINRRPSASLMNAIQSNVPGIYALVGRSIADVERDLILETLKHCLGNRTRSANLLRVSIRTLRNKLNEYTSKGVYVPPPAHQNGRMAHLLSPSAQLVRPEGLEPSCAKA